MLFDTIEPVSARQRDPRLGKGNLFFTATGKATTFGKVANIAAHALGGPMLGSLAQQGLNKLAMNGLTGADTIQNARTSADKMIATGQMVDQAVMPILQTATNLFVPGAGAALSAATGAAQSITKPQQPVNAIPSVIPDPVGSEGAVNFTGDTSAGQLWQSPSLSITNPYKKPVYSFASGGFARKFAEERAKQGAGGVFTYQGKQYNTFYKEELQPDPSREMTPFPTPGVTGVNMGQIKQKIASVESGGNYNAVNPSTGALGKYQFLKSTLKDYGVNPDEFLRNPALQETVMDRHLKNQLPTAMSLMNRYGDQRDWGVGDFLAGIHLKGRTGLTRELATGRTNRPSRLNPSTDEYVSRTRMYFDGGITLYPKDDKESEDLLMTDEKTGELYGRMRKGEYILPQLMSLASGTIMDSDAPQAQKERALGRMLFGQLSKKPVDVAQFRFADGGGTPKSSEQIFRQKVKERDALQAQVDSLMANRKNIVGPNRKDAIDQQVIRLNRQINGLNQEISSGMNNVFQGSEMRGATATALNNIQSKSPLSRIQADKEVSALVTPIEQRRAERRARLGETVTAPASAGVVTPPAVSMATGRVRTGSQKAPAKPAAASVPMSVNPLTPRAQATKDFAPVSLNADLSGRIPSAGVTNTAAPATSGTTTGSGFNLSRLSGDLMDAGKLAFGASIASRPIESPSIPPIWTNYMGELANRKNQGLTPEEMALAGNNMVNNYRQGVSALSQVAGGGASPGTVLTGLSNLGLQRGNQSQSLLAMDAAARNTNFARYGAGVGQTAAMEQGIQADRINRQTQDRAVGLGLVQNALTGIQERDTYYQNQPLYDKYFKALTDRENETAQTLRNMRISNSTGKVQ